MKTTNSISTGVPLEKVKPFDTGLELTLFNLRSDRVCLKFNNFVLVQKKPFFTV